jgi:hypothetical protein
MKANTVRILLITTLASTGAINICLAKTGSSTPSGQAPDFQVKFSEPLAVYVFVQNLSSKAFVPDNQFKKLFRDSKFNQEKYKALLAVFDTLTLDYAYEYGPEKLAGSTWLLLKRNLINSRTIDDFKRGALGIIPNASLFKLCSILTEFVPVYRELVYEPNKEVFERQLGEMRKLIVSANMTSYFNTGIKFYNSSWDNSIAFNLVFYPLPNSRGWMATAFYDNAESAIPTSLTDYNGLLSVAFHEIFHTLYDEQSPELKKEIVQWFISNPSKNSRYALSLLDESLATTLGNGYVSARLNGKENPGNWYNDKYINLMAKKIYPRVKEYIESQRSIDKSFVDNYVGIYDDNLAVFSELNNILASRYALSDNPQDFNVIDRKFPQSPRTPQYEAISESSIERMAKTAITKVILISKDNKRKLELIKKGFAELDGWKPNAKTDFTYSVLLKDKTYLIVVNSVGKTAEEQLGTLKLK